MKQLTHLHIKFGTSGKYSGEQEFGVSDYLIRYELVTEFDNALKTIGEVL